MREICKYALQGLGQRKVLSILLMAQLFIVIIVLNISFGFLNEVFSLRMYITSLGLHQSQYLYSTSDIPITAQEARMQLGDEKCLPLGTIALMFARQGSQDEVYSVMVWDDVSIEHIHLPLDQGSWLPRNQIGTYIPSIVSSNLADTFTLGEVYTFHLYITPLEYVSVSLQVVGVLDSPNYVITTQGNNIDFIVQKHYQGFIIPESSLPLAEPTNHSGFIVFSNEESISSDSLPPSLRVEPINSMMIMYEARQKDSIFFAAALGIMVLVITVAGLGGNNLLSQLNQEREFAVYYICGARWVHCVKIKLVQDMLLIFLPFLLSFSALIILSKVKLIIFSFNYLGYVMSIILCALIFVLTSLGPLLQLYKKAPVSIIRRWL